MNLLKGVSGKHILLASYMNPRRLRLFKTNILDWGDTYGAGGGSLPPPAQGATLGIPRGSGLDFVGKAANGRG